MHVRDSDTLIVFKFSPRFVNTTLFDRLHLNKRIVLVALIVFALYGSFFQTQCITSLSSASESPVAMLETFGGAPRCAPGDCTSARDDRAATADHALVPLPAAPYVALVYVLLWYTSFRRDGARHPPAGPQRLVYPRILEPYRLRI